MKRSPPFFLFFHFYFSLWSWNPNRSNTSSNRTAYGYGYSDRYTNAIDVSQSAVNSFVLVVEEKLLTIYVNDKRLGAVDITKRTDGEIAFEVFQESGETTCTLGRIWVWSLE